MFSADQIADIQDFNKVYQNLMKQMDSAILEARQSHSIYQTDRVGT